MNRLDQCRAAIVGAGSIGPGWGNGKATAVRFAREGARILCIDRDDEAAEATARLIREEGGVAETLVADVVDRTAGDQIAEHMLSLWGGIDVFDYNVGISQRGGVADTTDADWSRILDVNLDGAMRLTRAMLPIMRRQEKGVLLYVSSIAAIASGPYSYVSYEVSKAGLLRLARSVARENARFGIRANTILPGLIETPHVNHFVDSQTSPEELAARRAAMVPMGRQGTAWDIANAALFLASDEAGFISGIELRVDGAMTA